MRMWVYAYVCAVAKQNNNKPNNKDTTRPKQKRKEERRKERDKGDPQPCYRLQIPFAVVFFFPPFVVVKEPF